VIDDWLYCALFLLAAASCALRGRRGDGRGAWTVAAAGVVVWGAAEIVFRLSAPNPHSVYPRVTQVMLFVAFSLAYTTLGLLARERVRRFDAVLALDGVLTGLAAAAVAAVLLFPTLRAGHAHGPAALPKLFLIGALFGLVFVVTVLGMTGWRPGPVWALIATAIAVNVVGDAVLVHLTDRGRFRRGSLADTMFVASALLLGLAAFYPSRHASAAREAARRLPAPLISSGLALGVLIAAVARGAGGVAAGLAAAALAVMIARMTVALELLERTRSQALADELTGLGNGGGCCVTSIAGSSPTASSNRLSWRCSTSMGSSATTTPSAIPAATRCSCAWLAVSPMPSRRASRIGWAATSSARSWRAPYRRRPCTAPSTPCRSTATRSRHEPFGFGRVSGGGG
jgi:hypothetical protein